MIQKKPKHLAIVMDGNGRWATERGLARVEGHRQGLEVVRRVMNWCIQAEIGILSLFAFSHENWERPEEEVNVLMDLFLQAIQQELPTLIQNGIQLNFLGASERLNSSLLTLMNQAQEATAAESKLRLNIAMNYSGKWDILQALQSMAKHQELRQLDLSQLEDLFEANLTTHTMPDPDLFIRTSGEQRISNFFLWQIAYTELYFCDVYWPDFDHVHFQQAMAFFANRERRFGKTSQQVQG